MTESAKRKILLQAAAVPFRISASGLEFCLITTLSGRWIVPKGVIDPGETAEETAAKEAYEEAGVRGQVVGEPIGGFEYEKWGMQLVVTAYLLEVTEELDRWPESDFRRRQWVDADRALQLLAADREGPLIEAAVERLGKRDGRR
jgi:phosphohistidine phosphatase